MGDRGSHLCIMEDCSPFGRDTSSMLTPFAQKFFGWNLALIMQEVYRVRYDDMYNTNMVVQVEEYS